MLRNEYLSNHTSNKIGGPADFFYQPTSELELTEAVNWAKVQKKPLTVLGGATNVLVSDDGIRGLVLMLNKLNSIEVKKENNRFNIVAMAGAPKSLLMQKFKKEKLAPAMFLAGLPGDVGGGIVMNAGIGDETCVPREFCEITDWVDVLRNGDIKRISKDQLKFSYRKSEGWQPGIIVRGGFSWPMEPNESVLEKVMAMNKWRIEKQPLEWPNTGSIFRNPLPHKAGQLIEECGLKGYAIGDAEVSEKHANFLVNKGNASSADMLNLIKHIQIVVKDKKEIDLETEVVLMGFEESST